MIGEVVSSHYEDMGAVDPALLAPEPNDNIRVGKEFNTYVRASEIVVEGQEGLMTRDHKGNRYGVEDAQYPNIVGRLTILTRAIDELYRAHREIDPKTVLHHDVDYRVGRARSGTDVISQTYSLIAGHQLPISGPGRTHFDGFMAEDDEAVVLNHGGTPTRVFIGAVRKFFKKGTLYGGIWSKPFAPYTVLLPHDRAILTNRDTLHRQSAQLHRRQKPSVFVRSVINTVESE